MIEITVVPPEYVPHYWDAAYPLLKKAFTHARFPVREEDVLKDCLNGTQTLWLIYEGNPLNIIAAVTVKVKQYPEAKAVCSEHLGGERADEWIDLLEETISSYGKSIGATSIEIIGRQGWWRHLKSRNWNTGMVMYHKEIE